MTVVTDELPNDVALLKRVIAEERQQRTTEIELLKAEQQAAIDAAVKAAVAAILRRYYGPRSESLTHGNYCCLDSASTGCRSTRRTLLRKQVKHSSPAA